ncbi:MAG: hypothetical protein EXS00_03365 [Phycisphaerales bacterium]|nr:hypothetical protein [Phycisphaerales bacterium]
MGPPRRVTNWERDRFDDAPSPKLLAELEIRITLRHEIGHHFGLSEEDLDRLGYG